MVCVGTEVCYVCTEVWCIGALKCLLCVGAEMVQKFSRRHLNKWKKGILLEYRKIKLQFLTKEQNGNLKTIGFI